MRNPMQPTTTPRVYVQFTIMHRSSCVIPSCQRGTPWGHEGSCTLWWLALTRRSSPWRWSCPWRYSPETCTSIWWPALFLSPLVLLGGFRGHTANNNWVSLFFPTHPIAYLVFLPHTPPPPPTLPRHLPFCFPPIYPFIFLLVPSFCTYFVSNKNERNFLAIFYSQNMIMKRGDFHKARKVSYWIDTKESISYNKALAFLLSTDPIIKLREEMNRIWKKNKYGSCKGMYHTCTHILITHLRKISMKRKE